MARNTYTYIEFPNGVRLAKQPDTRGAYRLRFTHPTTGDTKDHRIVDWDTALETAQLLAAGLDPWAKTQQARPGTTVAELVAHWLDTADDRNWAPSTRINSASVCRVHVLPVIGDLHVAEWGFPETQTVLRRARARLAPSSMHSLLVVLAGIATHARRYGYLATGQDPMGGVKLPGRAVARPAIPIDGDDIEKVATIMQQTSRMWWGHLTVYVGAYSGLRVGEMLALRGTDIDLDKGRISIVRQLDTSRNGRHEIPPKTARSTRHTFYPTWLDDDLGRRAREAGDRPMFPGHDGQLLPYMTFNGSWFTPARIAAGVKRAPNGRFAWRYHDLRHYFCTWALRSADHGGLGLPAADVSKAAGHASVATTLAMYVEPGKDWADRARTATATAAR